jgi:hypothetical protein
MAAAIAGCAGDRVVQAGSVDSGVAQRVVVGIQQLRGLDFKTPVPVVVKNRDEAEQMMVAEISHDHNDEELRIGSLAGAMTGLYPAGMDLKAETLKLLRDQIVGFYDPDGKQMVLVSTNPSMWGSAALLGGGRDTVGEMLLAHELTHALQDQHFSIERMLDAVKHSDDRSLALKSVAEGDATLAGFGYVQGGLNETTVKLDVDHLANLQETFAHESRAAVPFGLSAPLLFQYSAGSSFVAEAWRRGGWAAVDRIYRDPPQSTQEIMQPALYFDHRSPPARIEISGYESALKGWRKVDDDTYGELLLEVIFEANLAPHAPVLKALPRWAGDRIVALENDQALTLIWMVAFRDPDAAELFSAGYGDVLKRIASTKDSFRIERQASVVLVAIGDSARNFDAFAPQIWKASSVSAPEPATIAAHQDNTVAHGSTTVAHTPRTSLN